MGNENQILDQHPGISSFEDISKQVKMIESLQKKYFEIVTQLAKQSNLQQLKDAIDAAEAGTDARLKAQKAYEDECTRISKQAAEATQQYIDNVKKQGTEKQKADVIAAINEQAKIEQDSIDETLSKRVQAIDIEANAKKQAIQEDLEAELASIDKKYKTKKARDKHKEQATAKAQEKINDVESDSAKQKNAERIQADAAKSQVELKRIMDEGSANATRTIGAKKAYGRFSQQGREAALGAAADAAKNVEQKHAERAEILAKLEEAKESGDALAQEQLEAQLENNALEVRAAQEEQSRASKEAATAALLEAMLGQYKQAYSEAENFLTTYASRTDARLQGSDEKFTKLTDKITTTLSINPFVKSTDVLSKLTEAVDAGIAYNLEQRAFLAGISDKIATTFNAFDSNLTRIIKLQQADSTAARLGMEAYLTKFLNTTFKDTSYLTDGFDSVTQAITDAITQLDYKQGAELEFVVQKWMASMSSLGVSNEALNNIAQGINALALGDVSTLSGNQQLQTLLVGASNQANLEYADLLLEGLSPDKTNKLLEGVILYLQDIAANTDSQVVKSAYKDVLGISVTDLKAISGLRSDEIANISNMQMSYTQMQQETNSQLNKLITRVTLPEMLDNIYSNVMYATASDMVNNPVSWAMDKMLNFMRENKLDISLPFISAFGNGFDLNDTIVGLMEKALGLGKGFSFMANLLGGLSSGGGFSLDSWEATETLTRGDTSGFGLTKTSGTSTSATYVTNNNTQDTTKSTIAEAGKAGEENVGGLETEEQKRAKERTVSDVYNLFKPIIVEGSYLRTNLKSNTPIHVLNDVLTNAANGTKPITIKTLSPMPVNVNNETLSVKITNASALQTSQQLSISNLELNLDAEVLKQSFIDASSDEKFKENFRNMFFNQGSIDVWVKNEVEVKNKENYGQSKYIF